MKKLFYQIALTIFFGIVFPVQSNAQTTELSIIGNLESVPSEMTMELLKAVLRGEKMRWVDGSAIKIALMKTNTPVGTLTCEKIYNMSGNQLNKYFLALVFQGKVKAPTFFNSLSELEQYVARTPGAIGVSQNTSDDQIKVVRIDGGKQVL